MLKIGITGSIGSGKTTVCRIFETLGIPVYYADDRGKYLLQHHKKVIDQIVSGFGGKVYSTDQTLDPAALAEIVFNNPVELNKLENIVHPAVFEDFKEWLSLQKAPYIIKEAALLFEAGTYKELDKLITVSAPFPTRLHRVLSRDNISEEQVLARENRQWPEEKKIEMADFVVSNDEQQLLLPQVLKLHKELLAMQ